MESDHTLLRPGSVLGPTLSRRGLIALGGALPLVAMQGPGPAMAQTSATPEAERHFTATLEANPPRARIGEMVEITGGDYPAGAEVDLVWYSVKGRFEIEQRAEFIGQRYETVSETIATLTADSAGQISGTIEVPSGFGGPHDVRAAVKGEEIAQVEVMVLPTVTMAPNEGPVGTEVELHIAGVDLRTNLNTWHLLYDNSYLGFMSAVTTDGLAVANFRAAGAIGRHIIQVWRNAYNSTPYLAADTSPFAGEFGVGMTFDFHVTEDRGVIEPFVDDFSATDDPWPLDVAITGQGELVLSTDRGEVGAPATLTGTGMPANTTLQLRYSKMVGNRVSAIGFSEEVAELGEVETDANGSFTEDTTIPDDLGGYHRFEVVDGVDVRGAAGFMILPSVVSVSTTVQAGEEIEIHFKGIGWTTYDNTYAVTYDNSFIGYVCGFSTNGDVHYRLIAVGAPGTHLIDHYPAIYKGKDLMPKTYAVPQLTYRQDHPGRTLPAIRLSVEMVE